MVVSDRVGKVYRRLLGAMSTGSERGIERRPLRRSDVSRVAPLDIVDRFGRHHAGAQENGKRGR
jgi:hypothetical protein